MTARALRRAALPLLLGALGCSYDLDALRRGDGAVRDLGNNPLDRGPPPDMGFDAGPPDIPPAPIDTGPPDVLMGTCTLTGGSATPLNPGMGGVLIEGSNNSTTGAVALNLPDTIANTSCQVADDAGSPLTRVFRYQVRGGSRVTVTTNTGLCNPIDTRVYLLRGCDTAAVMRPINCGDDLGNVDSVRCGGCSGGEDTTNMGGCFGYFSTVQQPSVPGDTFFVAVNGYANRQGNFRLWVGENAAKIEPFPAMLPSGVTPVNRCGCVAQGAVALTPVTARFPTGAANGQPAGMPLTTNMFEGVMVPTGPIAGISAQFRVNRTLSTEERCLTAPERRATFELIVGSTMVTAFSLDPSVGMSGVVTVPFTAFRPHTLGGGGLTRVQLQYRESNPSGCLSFEFDRASTDNQLSFYRSMAGGDGGT